MNTLTVTCNICGGTLLTIEKDLPFSIEDINLYQDNTSCSADGPIQTYDDSGNPLTMDYSNIVVSISED